MPPGSSPVSHTLCLLALGTGPRPSRPPSSRPAVPGAGGLPQAVPPLLYPSSSCLCHRGAPPNSGFGTQHPLCQVAKGLSLRQPEATCLG